ncbi:MAG: hypothetical protein HYZ53_12240 [Planctomycetes bacterium]|nr:hypothetical protein [Planctomycetota bacterium]
MEKLPLAILLALSSLLPWPPVDAGTGAFQVLNRPLVYHGDPDDFSAPAVLEALRCFERIPEYQEIKRRKLPPNDPEYGILLEKANKRFFRAVCRLSRRDGYDLIAELGAVVRRGGDPLKDVTEDAIRLIEEDL